MPLSMDTVVIREDDLKIMTRPFFVKFKKHYCTKCGSNLKIAWITQLIERDSCEALGKNLAFGPKWLFKKPIKYTFAIFECTNCHNRISIGDQYFFQNPHKKERHLKKYPNYYLSDDYHNYLKCLDMKKDKN